MKEILSEKEFNEVMAKFFAKAEEMNVIVKEYEDELRKEDSEFDFEAAEEKLYEMDLEMRKILWDELGIAPEKDYLMVGDDAYENYLRERM